MSDNKMLYTLIGLSAAIFAIQKYNESGDVVENFGGIPTRTVRVDRVVQQSPRTGDFVTIPGTYDAMLNPRGGAGNVDYGAFIRYNPPDHGKLASSSSFSNYANMVTEKFCGACSAEGYCGGGACNSAGCRNNGGNGDVPSASSAMFGKKSNMPPSAFAAGNFNQKMSNLGYNDVTDMLPVQGMNSSAVNALGQAGTQPIIYDRYVYANQRSRLAGSGDMIRGDLPIAPLAKGWFSPSVNPQIDLRDGALAVTGGIDNDTTKSLMALKTAAAGGLLDTGSGINYAVQKSGMASAAGGDIKWTAFP